MEYIRKAVESRETSLYDDIVAKIKKDITCNSDYIFALLSDNTINVINKKDKIDTKD